MSFWINHQIEYELKAHIIFNTSCFEKEKTSTFGAAACKIGDISTYNYQQYINYLDLDSLEIKWLPLTIIHKNNILTF